MTDQERAKLPSPAFCKHPEKESCRGCEYSVDPEAYDPALKKWTVDTLPFLPKEYKYEIIESAADQFKIVKQLLLRPDVDKI